MPDMMRRPLGKTSFVEIEGSVWSITYPRFGIPPFYTVDYHEAGLWLHLGQEDIEQSQKSFQRLMKVLSTSIGAAGGSVVPGPGTAAGALSGAALGLVLSELADIALEIVKHLATDDRGGFDIHMSPHGFQCGQNFAGDPNIFLGPLWRPIYSQLRKLQPRAPGGRMEAAREEAVDAASVDTSKPMTGERRPRAAPEGGAAGKGGKKTKDAPAPQGGAATSPAAAAMVSLATPVTGVLALGKTHYWKFKPKGETLKFKVYSRLLEDTHAVEASVAISDEDGGVIDRTTIVVSEQGEDFSVETVEIELPEPMETAVLSIKSRNSMSDAPRFEYRIKLG